MEEFKTDRLVGRTLGPDDQGWQQPVTDGRNPVDAALDWLMQGGVISPHLMFPLALASLAGLTMNEMDVLIAKAKAEDPENWLDRLRTHWPPSPAPQTD
ncbi:hypothetical protein [Belnapia rosea]|uniref:hypothetical protein n=1 Tax=Belnapia rosea TaxID=938405 RepID=UPI00115FB1EB|nr:hypothetical protein [Belnapia rosea]